MNVDEARQILVQSITNLEKRKGGITRGDLEAEVINNACLSIIKNQNSNIENGSSIQEWLVGALNSSQDYLPIAQSFIRAAKELLPEYFGKDDAETVMVGIEQNLAWEGMWEFLVDYFEKNHGIKIDGKESRPILFFSDKQQTYESGLLVKEIDEEKTVFISFTLNKQMIRVKIDPDLPPQKGVLVSRDKHTLKYKNEDYYFTVQYDEYNEVDSFVLDKLDENQEVFYLE